MLCIDTSSLIAYLEGGTGRDVEIVDQALLDQVGLVSPVTITEVLSDPHLSRTVRELILQLPVLPITEGFWERAGRLRAKILQTRHKAKLADTLIAQNCLDHGASLVTRDDDFKAFKRIAGLRILSTS
jgi:predicted nucleic acid-binding protein